MGTISFSATALFVILILLGIIAIFPVNFFGLYLEPLHQLKNTLSYGGTVFLYFAILVSFGIGIARVTSYVRENKALQNLARFLLTFDHKYYVRMRKQLA